MDIGKRIKDKRLELKLTLVLFFLTVFHPDHKLPIFKGDQAILKLFTFFAKKKRDPLQVPLSAIKFWSRISN